jgi:high-affinity iron transporter
VAAYLEGVEPHEAALRARDPALALRIEAGFLTLRRTIDQTGASPQAGDGDAVAREAAQLRLLLDRAEEHETSWGVLFVASLTIALREGLETALLIAALLAFLRKSGREDSARLVHLGWLTAIPAGLVTWFFAGALLQGARRELVEAVITLLAAVLILGVTHWVLGRLEAQHWVGYLRRKVTAAASGPGSRAWPLWGLAFFAAYREAVEVVLFYRALLLDAGGSRWPVALGAVAGLAGIGVVLLVVQRLGRRLNPRPVMLVSSVILAALALALVGRGVRALQEGGYIGLTPLGWPELPWLGLYASREGLMAQAAALMAVVLPSLVRPSQAQRV